MAKKNVLSQPTTLLVGPPTGELKGRFMARSIPLETDFADLIDVADCGRKAVGLNPDFPPIPETGLTLDSTTGLLKVQPAPDNGIQIDATGIGLVPWQMFHKGMVMMFAGTEAEIPEGWEICDGNNGTPDLRDRFIVMAGSKFTGVGDGTTTTNSTKVTAAVTVEATALTIEQIPSHTHNYTYRALERRRFDGDNWEVNYVIDSYPAATTAVGGGQKHTHGAKFESNSHAHTFSAIPPYFAMIFIMKT